MKLDFASKVIAILSTIVALILSVATYFGGQELKLLREEQETFETNKLKYLEAPKVAVEHHSKLAREFALGMADQVNGKIRIMIPTNSLSDQLLSSWRDRKGLMTGAACEKEGLKARQIALIQITNYGPITATDVRLIVKKGNPKNYDQKGRWQVVADGRLVSYSDLNVMANDWPEEEISIGELVGVDANIDYRNKVQIVLASIAGSSDFYGPILVPLRITWYDPVKHQNLTQDISLQYFRSALLGAEIGSLSESCRKL